MHVYHPNHAYNVELICDENWDEEDAVLGAFPGDVPDTRGVDLDLGVAYGDHRVPAAEGARKEEDTPEQHVQRVVPEAEDAAPD